MKQAVVCLAAVFGLLISLPAGFGQTGQGGVTGIVTDASGGVVAGAALTLTNEGTSVTQQVQSSNGGDYRFALVPPGTYTLTVKAGGFTDREIKRITVNASQVATINVPLSVASASTTVEVTTQDSLVQTATSDFNTTINTRTVAETPLLSRSVFDLSFLAPTVSPGMNGQAAAGGVRESGTAYILNGADDNDNFGEGGRNITPPLESVGEVTVITNSMSAQYGRSAGAVVSASQKSGTNAFHGVAYEFNRNSFVGANDFLNNRTGADKPQFNRNQFGGEIDGPIKRDHTFFAFAYDKVALHTGSPDYSAVQVLTPSDLAQLQATAGPLARQVLAAYPQRSSNTPCPNEPAAALGHIGCVALTDPLTDPTNSYFGRVDQNFGEKNRLSGSVNFSRENYQDALGGGHATSTTPIPLSRPEHYHNIALVDTYTINPTVVNEFTLSHNRHYSNYQAADGTSTLPEIVIDGQSYAGFGTGIGVTQGSLIQSFTQDRWQAQDNISVTRGKHTIKFGGSYQYGILYRNWDLGGPGQYIFDNVFGQSAAALGYQNADGSVGGTDNQIASGVTNFQNDFPYYSETSIDPATGAKADAYRHYAYRDMGVFINDDWKVSRKLTVNAGFRWERFGAPREVGLRLAQFPDDACLLDPSCISTARVTPQSSMWHTNDHDFSPRVGFAYDLFGNGKTAIRGSYGIFYDRIFDNVWSNSAWNPPFYALVDSDGTNGDSIFYSLPASVGPTYEPNSIPGVKRVALRTMEHSLKDSSAQNMFFSVEHQFASTFLARASYQGSLGRHLPVLENLNRYDGLGYNTRQRVTLPNSFYNGFNYRANNISSSYHSVIGELQKRFSQGLQFQFAFTYGKLIDYGSDLFSGETGRQSNSQPYYFVSNQHPEFEKGLGAFDHTYGYKVNFVYELPWLRNQKNFLGQALGGWTVSSFFQAYSGHPLSVCNSRIRYAGDAVDANGVPENLGGDYNLDGTGQDRPVYLGENAHSLYSGASPADGVFKSSAPVGCGFGGNLSSASSVAACNSNFGVTSPNPYFTNPSGQGVKFGSLGRNVFRGPWFNGFNLSLSKNFKLTERLQLQIRGEAFNLLNHANFDNIITDVSSAKFGQAQMLVQDGSTSIADPGNISRRFQFGARISF